MARTEKPSLHSSQPSKATDTPQASQSSAAAYRMLPRGKGAILLTPAEAQALCELPSIDKAVKKRIDPSRQSEQEVTFTRKQLEQLEDCLVHELMFPYLDSPDMLETAAGKVYALLDELRDQEMGQPPQGLRLDPEDPAPVALQFKVTLLDLDPPIWRRIQFPNGTFGDLHSYIQAAFEWDNAHLHEFRVGRYLFGPVLHHGSTADVNVIDEKEYSLFDLLPESGNRARWHYLYDFGDDWRHEILFEGYAKAVEDQYYPLCLEGEESPPPEDCGGPWVYQSVLDGYENENVGSDEDFLYFGFMKVERDRKFDAQSATRAMQNIFE